MATLQRTLSTVEEIGLFNDDELTSGPTDGEIEARTEAARAAFRRQFPRGWPTGRPTIGDLLNTLIPAVEAVCPTPASRSRQGSCGSRSTWSRGPSVPI
jgi:hypothetical protein